MNRKLTERAARTGQYLRGEGLGSLCVRRRSANPAAGARASAFTLIELLVVLAIIGVLAGLVLTVLSGVDKSRTRKLVAAQMAQLETALHQYQARIGYYPPWPEPADSGRNPLYYELVGSVRNGGQYETENRRFSIPISSVSNACSSPLYNFTGVLNSGSGTLNPSDPDSVRLANYLPGLKPTQVKADSDGVRFLGVPVKGPGGTLDPTGRFCVWQYRCPGKHHPESFDLWVEVTLDDKTVTIGNWQRTQ